MCNSGIIVIWVTIHFPIGLKAYFIKGSINMTSRATRTKSTTVTLLNGQSVKLTFLNLSLLYTDYCNFHTASEKWAVVNTRTHNWAKCRGNASVECSATDRIRVSHLEYQGPPGTKKWKEDCKSQHLGRTREQGLLDRTVQLIFMSSQQL